MEHCRLQFGCLIVLLYIGFIYLRECRQYHLKLQGAAFDELLALALFSVVTDAATAYTVNHLDTVPPLLNTVLHAMFLIGLDLVVFALFLYMMRITDRFPKKKSSQRILYGTVALTVAVIIAFIGDLEYRVGVTTNYSMGISVYVCFGVVGLLELLSVGVFLRGWRYIDSNKRVGIFTYLLVLAAVTVAQCIFPEILMTSVAVTVFTIAVYTNMEDPTLRQIANFHSETVMSFANLIENRDDNTGGHIKRTSRYVELIAEELVRKGYYCDVLTKDYMEDLVKAAPMHDIGKIAVPDAILCKPGKLSEEEYAAMKSHAPNGGEIVREIFCNLGDEQYQQIAYETARHHHERWNGMGYPDGLRGEQIPLSARIMAVADVFDAISERRCYREAMPMEECFEIISRGRGVDFDPRIVEVFLDSRVRVEEVHGAPAAVEAEPAAAC